MQYQNGDKVFYNDEMHHVTYADKESNIIVVMDSKGEQKKVDSPDLEKYFEKRMYYLVMYNLSDIQKGIQAGHSLVEYVRLHGGSQDFRNFAKYDKTFIVLNGGTSNDGEAPLYGAPTMLGTMEEHVEFLSMLRYDYGGEFRFAYFNEPDLNRSTSAICFLADERVWDRKRYHDFTTWLAIRFDKDRSIMTNSRDLTDMVECYEKHVHIGYNLDYATSEMYHKWKSTVMGGNVNVALRELISNKKLA